MKSKLNATVYQTIVGDDNPNFTIGYLFIRRTINTDNLIHQYAYGESNANATFTSFFTGLDNQ